MSPSPVARSISFALVLCLATQTFAQLPQNPPHPRFFQGEAIGVSSETLAAVADSEPSQPLSTQRLMTFAGPTVPTALSQAAELHLNASSRATVELRAPEVERQLWTEAFVRKALQTKDVDAIARIAAITMIGRLEGYDSQRKKDLFDFVNSRIHDIQRPVDPSSAFEVSGYVRKVLGAVTDAALSNGSIEGKARIIKTGIDIGIDFVVDSKEYLDLSQTKIIQDDVFGMLNGPSSGLLKIPGELYDTLSKDPDFGAKVADITRADMGVSIGDGVSSIFAMNPELLDSVLGRDAYRMTKDSQDRVIGIEVDLKKLSKNVDQGFTKLNELQSQNMLALHRFAGEAASRTAQVVVAKLEEREQAIRQLNTVQEAKDTGLRATLGFFQLGMGTLGGDAAKFGKMVNTTGNAAIQVAGAIEKYNNQMAAIDAMVHAGQMAQQGAQTATMMANIGMAFTVVGAGVAVFSLVQSFSAAGQDSADMIIIKQLGAIMKQLEEIRREMREGFDRVSAQIAENIRLTELGFQRVMVDLGKIRREQDDAALNLFRLRDLVERRTASQLAAMQDLFSRLREGEIRLCVRNATDASVPMAVDRLNDCAGRLKEFGTDTRMIGERASGAGWGAVETEQFLAMDLYEWKYLANSLNAELGAQFDSRLPDTKAWYLASEGMAQMAATRSRPGTGCKEFGSELDSLISSGESIENFVTRMRGSSVLDQLVAKYTVSLEAFDKRLEEVAKRAWTEFHDSGKSLTFNRSTTGDTPATDVKFRGVVCGDPRVCGDSPGSLALWDPLSMSQPMYVQSPVLLGASRAGLGRLSYDYGMLFKKIVIGGGGYQCAGDLHLKMMARWLSPSGEGAPVEIESPGVRISISDNGSYPTVVSGDPVGGTPVPEGIWPNISEHCGFAMYKDQAHQTARKNRSMYLQSFAEQGWAPTLVHKLESPIAGALVKVTEEKVRPELLKFYAEAIQKDLISGDSESLHALSEKLTLIRALMEKTLNLVYPAELPRYPGLMRSLTSASDRLWDTTRLTGRLGDPDKVFEAIHAMLKVSKAPEATTWRETIVTLKSPDAKITQAQKERKTALVELAKAQKELESLRGPAAESARATQLKATVADRQAKVDTFEANRIYTLFAAMESGQMAPDEMKKVFDPSQRILSVLKQPLVTLKQELAVLAQETRQQAKPANLSPVTPMLQSLRLAKRLSCQ